MVTIYDGFESYTDSSSMAGNWTTGIGVNINNTGGIKSGKAISMAPDDFNNVMSYNIAKTISDSTQMSVGFAMKLPVWPTYANNANSNPLLDIFYNSTLNLRIYIRYSTAFQGYYPQFVFNSVTINGGKIPNYKSDIWNYYEVEITPGITGRAKLYFDGSVILDVPSGNFSASSTELTNGVRIYGDYRYDGYATLIDDFYITDSPSRIGQIHCELLVPTGDTAQKQWTPSTGTTNFNLINSKVFSNTTQLSTSTQGAYDSYSLTDISSISSNIGDIISIMPRVRASKSSYGQTSVSVVFDQGGSLQYLPNFTLTETFSLMSYDLMTVNPFTNAPWLSSDIDSMNIGIMSFISDQSKAILASIGPNAVILNSSTTLNSGINVPPSSGSYLEFDGTRKLWYTDSATVRIDDIFSVEIDISFTDISNNPIIFNLGGDSTNQPELSIAVNSDGQVMIITSSDNVLANNQEFELIPAGIVNLGTFNRIGSMIYYDGSNFHLRGYFNGIAKFDEIIDPPYDSTAGFSISGYADNTTANLISGTIKNLNIGKTNYWPI